MKMHGQQQMKEGKGVCLGQDSPVSQKGQARAASCAEGMGKVGGCAEPGTEMSQPRYEHQGTALALTEGNGLTPIDVNEA